MHDYAAIWSEEDRPGDSFVVGRVAVEPGRLALDGQTDAGLRYERAIAADEIRGVDRVRRPRVWGQSTGLRLELHSGEALEFTPVLGVGTSIDLLDDLRVLIAEARRVRLEAEARREEAAALRNQAELQLSRARRLRRQLERWLLPGSPSQTDD